MSNIILRLLPRNASLRLRRWRFKHSSRDQYDAWQASRHVVDERGYSFKGFDEKKAIFIHVPKCAGVSVAQSIFGNHAGGHTTLDSYLRVFELDCIDEYFKFTIVRNPWDRLVSAYFFLKKGGFGEADRDWFAQELSSYSNFDEFVKQWLNESNIWKRHHFRPQHHYFIDKARKVTLDFIGYLENLDKDFHCITRRIGVDCELPEDNKSVHKDYRDYYTDETREIVGRVYQKDIKLLGYDFDNSSLESQIRRRDSRMKL